MFCCRHGQRLWQTTTHLASQNLWTEIRLAKDACPVNQNEREMAILEPRVLLPTLRWIRISHIYSSALLRQACAAALHEEASRPELLELRVIPEPQNPAVLRSSRAAVRHLGDQGTSAGQCPVAL